MRRPLAAAATALLLCPTLWGCAVVGAGVRGVHSEVAGMADAIHSLAFGARNDSAPTAYTRDALAEAAVLYPPALTTVFVPAHHPRLTAAVRAAGYAVTDEDGPPASGALRVRFHVHSGAAGVDVAVLQLGEQVLTRGYMDGQPATGWSFDARNAPPETLARLRLVQLGLPIDRVSFAYAGSARVDAPSPSRSALGLRSAQP